MNVIFDSADSQRRQVVFARDPADVVPDALFNLLVNEIASLFCAEDDVIEMLGVCVCHLGDCFQLPLTRQERVLTYSGLKATAKRMRTLRVGALEISKLSAF